MKSRIFSGFVAAFLLVCPSPILAVDPTPADLQAMNDGQLDKAISVLQAKDDSSKEDTCSLAAYLTERTKRQKTEATDSQAMLVRGVCASSRDDWGAALVDFAKAETLTREEMTPDRRMALETLLLTAAAVTNDKVAFETHLTHVADRGWPDEFRSAEPRLWNYGIYLMDKPAREQLCLILAKSGAFISLPAELQDEIAAVAVRPAVMAGDTHLAATLARDTASPGKLLNMLIDRDYAPIWPQLEEFAGPHMQRSIAANLQKQRERAAKNPDDLDALSELVDALTISGDYAGAVQAAAKIDHSPDATAHWTEADGWVLNIEIKALDRSGRRGEADALSDRLGTIGADKDHSWVVSFVINRADRLLSQGRWREALPASELAVTVANEFGNGYAKESARVNRLCAADKIDPKRSELAAWWPEIAQGWRDNASGAITAALCKGDRVEARRLLVLALADPDLRSNVLPGAQPVAFGLYGDFGADLPDPAVLFVSDSALTKLFEKYGRILPKELLPH